MTLLPFKVCFCLDFGDKVKEPERLTESMLKETMGPDFLTLNLLLLAIVP